MTRLATIPKIQVGDWTWAGEDGTTVGDPALSHHGIEFAAGTGYCNSAALRKAALDLMKLAAAVQAAGF
jgi:hypothetical protein